MTQSERSDNLPIDDPRMAWLEQLLQRHQATITIDYLYDHGWQVHISNPGGSLYVHACEYPNKLPRSEPEPNLADTIYKAAEQARREGWW